MLDRSSIKLRQDPDMNIIVEWDAKPQIKQTNIPCQAVHILAIDQTAFSEIALSVPCTIYKVVCNFLNIL